MAEKQKFKEPTNIPGLRVSRRVHFIDDKGVHHVAVVHAVKDASGALDVEVFPNGGRSFMQKDVLHDPTAKNTSTWHMIEKQS